MRLGHSFQYQVYCDRLLNGAADDQHAGFRYGYGRQWARGGNAFWEQCAQWQSFQDVSFADFRLSRQWCGSPTITAIVDHEWMRYASYWAAILLDSEAWHRGDRQHLEEIGLSQRPFADLRIALLQQRFEPAV
jgi:hypothetical protein